MAPDTDDVRAEVQRELTVFARRIRASSAQLHPDLPFVAYSMLSHIDTTGGCRSVDLVRLYRLDRSTVSRQVADLEHRGLVTRSPDPAGGRGVLLQVTPAGAALLEEACTLVWNGPLGAFETPPFDHGTAAVAKRSAS